MMKLREIAFSHIKSVDDKLVATVCGSFRRGAASSGDIDVLIGHPDYTSEVKKKPDIVKRVVAKMEGGGFVTDTLSLGETKFMVSWGGGGGGGSCLRILGRDNYYWRLFDGRKGTSCLML